MEMGDLFYSQPFLEMPISKHRPTPMSVSALCQSLFQAAESMAGHGGEGRERQGRKNRKGFLSFVSSGGLFTPPSPLRV